MLDGLLGLSPLTLVLVTLALTHVTIAAVTIFLHRCQAHNALTLHPIVSHFFRGWLWLTTGMVTREWVAIHRKHHARCERPGDPHSPRVFGLRKVLWQGSELYRQEARDQATIERFGAGTPDDWIERRLYRRFPWLGILVMLVIDLVLFGAFGLTVWAVQMLWIPFWAAGVVNGVGHHTGYRNFETPDASRNLSPIGVLIGGEELHNNHHAYPASACLASRRWELDIGWVYIRLLSLFGLARVRKLAPRIAIETDRRWLDIGSLQTIVRNRFHVLSLYGRRVVTPTLKHEVRGLSKPQRRLLKAARALMIREDITLDERNTATLQQALTLSGTLETVYRFREQLKAIWSQTDVPGELRLQQLRDWCARAELTGIQALHEFAATLKGYRLQPA